MTGPTKGGQAKAVRRADDLRGDWYPVPQLEELQEKLIAAFPIKPSARMRDFAPES